MTMKRKTKLQVLYVEDDEDSRELVSFIFGLADIEVILAKTADEAWKSAHAHKFDIFLLDGMLAAGSSLSLCGDLHKFAPKTPILFYSALAYPVDVQNGMDAGANGYLVKPYFGDLSEMVLNTVRTAGGMKEREESLQEKFEEVMIFDRTVSSHPVLGFCA
jgi:DNA-binding response OmpR family regulator